MEGDIADGWLAKRWWAFKQRQRARELPYSLTSNCAEKVCCGLSVNFAKIFHTPMLQHSQQGQILEKFQIIRTWLEKGANKRRIFLSNNYFKEKSENRSPQKFSKFIMSRLQAWFQNNCFMRQSEAVGCLNIKTFNRWDCDGLLQCCWWQLKVYHSTCLNFNGNRSATALLSGLHAGCQRKDPVLNCGKTVLKNLIWKIPTTHITKVLWVAFSTLEWRGWRPLPDSPVLSGV